MITPLYLVSTANAPRLRVAVLLDGPTTPRYVAAILEDIASSNFADVELAVILDPGGATAPRCRGLARELYVRVDRAIIGDADVLAEVEPVVGLAGVDRLLISAVGEAGEPWLPADALEEIQRRELDVILRFCTETPRGEVLRAARRGVWSYHFGVDEDPRGRMPLLQQIMAPTRHVSLEVLEEPPAAGLVLCRSSFGNLGGVVLARLRQVSFWETTHFVVWKLHDLHELGWEHVVAHALPRLSEAPTPPPSTTDLLGSLVPRLVRAVVHRVRGTSHQADRWKLGLRRGATPLGATKDATTLAGFHWLERTPGHFFADPFLVEHDGTPFLFFEDFDYDRDYASIGRAEVRDDCSLGPVTTCLDRGYHLSFPFVFEHDGEMFMIPESMSDGTVTLYRARRFPDEWVEEKVLFRGKAADSTLWREDGRFYFFTTLHDRNDRGMKTVLFVADSLVGDWRLHRGGPVSSDAHSARNGGAIFRRNGRLFRPAQNCGPSYGYGLSVQEIVSLSEDHYEERPWCSVGPHAVPFPAVGVHTYNTCGDLEVVDAREPKGAPTRALATASSTRAVWAPSASGGPVTSP